MLVTDASAVIDLLVGADWADRLADVIRGETLVAPEILDVEVASTLARLHRSGTLSSRQADEAFTRFQTLPIDRVSHRNINETAWQLRGQLRMADAYYAALTQLLGVVLLTTDVKLMRSGQVHCVKLDV